VTAVPATQPGRPGARWELLRALGAVADTPAAARAAGQALGLPAVSDAEHTTVFVLNCPPYAAVYLGPEGALGGEGADRVAGFWRALGITPPAEPDHLAALLGLYAQLGEAADGATRPATADALARARAVLLAEHLWPWLPGYLDAAAALDAPALAAWARLAQRALAAEYAELAAGYAGADATGPEARLPLALRAAPAGLTAEGRIGDLTAALTTPVRSGMILTRHRLAAGAGQAAVGHRIGERRFTLRAMLDQDPAATLGWLAAEARRWQARHTSRPGPTSRWWAARAGQTAALLADSALLADRAGEAAQPVP
jgi:TorA maturation chaperone TorD